MAALRKCEWPFTHCFWQGLPSASPQHMPLAGIAVGRGCHLRSTSAGRLHSGAAGRGGRRRVLSACRLRVSWLAGAAAGEVLVQVARSQNFGWQVLPEARVRRMTWASTDAGRCCRRHDLSACRVHAWWLAGAAVPLAAIVAGRSGRRRATSACPLHPLVLAGEAAG